MSAPLALLVVLGLVALATAAGLVWRARTGRVRAARADLVTASDVGAAGLGSRATLVQFSTAFCAQCPGTARVLAGVARERDGVEHLDVDLTVRPELARRFGVLQTPTTLLLDARGAVRGRIAGAARPDDVRSALDRILTE
ncbi:thioredoxin family protein [Leifsonia shinshuensis]|uniref:Thiol-disulfide isomerase/thioredoxin n=1 Tax=Leifsonia shinshuensis TaxID=150026 RepID=A0A853CWS9_9MICO|nr:thioredoxin family protein [Leifsonia shinshuensis]NYJ23624.1 thiol-disulfide isomerase/thioredoxin [Leifsonia shinshuensis]